MDDLKRELTFTQMLICLVGAVCAKGPLYPLLFNILLILALIEFALQSLLAWQTKRAAR